MKISNQTENRLLSRKEVDGEIDFKGATPSNDELAKSIASNLKSTPDLVVVKKIYTEFGKTHATFDAIVYDNKEAKDTAEKMTKHMKEKQKKAAEDAKKRLEEKKAAQEKKEEKPAEAKPEEKPAEEKKPEAKPEEKKE